MKGKFWVIENWEGTEIHISFGDVSDITITPNKGKKHVEKEYLKNERVLQRLLYRTGNRHPRKG